MSICCRKFTSCQSQDPKCVSKEDLLLLSFSTQYEHPKDPKHTLNKCLLPGLSNHSACASTCTDLLIVRSAHKGTATRGCVPLPVVPLPVVASSGCLLASGGLACSHPTS